LFFLTRRIRAIANATKIIVVLCSSHHAMVSSIKDCSGVGVGVGSGVGGLLGGGIVRVRYIYTSQMLTET
jgi:hypothetical protein